MSTLKILCDDCEHLHWAGKGTDALCMHGKNSRKVKYVEKKDGFTYPTPMWCPLIKCRKNKQKINKYTYITSH